MSMMGHNGAPQNGYILVNRAMLSHKIVGAGQPVKPHKPNRPTYSRYEAWQDLIMMASYQDQTVTIGGKTYQLRMGEAVCARTFLSARWNWSDKTVRAFIKRLIDHGMVLKSRDEKGQKANRLSVCNYSQYQRPNLEEGQGRGQQKGQQKGQQDNELTRCKYTENMFPDEPEGLVKGPTKGPQYKEYKINKNNNKLANSESSNTLNGSTQEVISSLAEWAFEGQYPYEAMAGQKPPEMFFKEAGRTLNSIVASCGAKAVVQAHADMMVKKMNNELVGNRLKLFSKIAGDYRKKHETERNRKSRGGVIRGNAIPGIKNRV